MMKIKETIGWEPFKQTFRFFSTIADSSVPSTNLGKLNLFLTKLQDYSGQNVFNMISSSEKTVYGNHFGGILARYTGTIVVDDHSNYMAEGTILTLGETMNGTINYAGDVDHFNFTTTIAGKYAVTTEGTSLSTWLWKVDTYTYVAPTSTSTYGTNGVTKVYAYQLTPPTAFRFSIYHLLLPLVIILYWLICLKRGIKSIVDQIKSI